MDRLENYLDRVCRGIGGPRALRQHVRQELREHLLDAVAALRAAGLSETEALDRALNDFGGPEEVGSELEATHGHRLLGVLIDRAMQWREMTMKAKWLWVSWAYLALGCVIVLQVLLLTFIVVFIIPKFQRLVHDGMLDAAELQEQGVGWMLAFLDNLRHVGGHYTTQLLLLAISLVGLFEWRVRSENKAFMRLSAVGTVAVGLMVVVLLTAGSLVVPFCLGMPALGRIARPWAVEQVAAVDASVGSLEQALARKDWPTVQEKANQASGAMTRLAAGPAVSSLTRSNDRTAVEELRSQLKAATECFHEAQKAVFDKDAERLKRELARFHELHEPIARAAAGK